MQNITTVQFEIEHLFFELNSCVNDLQNVRLQISIDEVYQAELSLNKLESLISFVKLSLAERSLVNSL